MNRIFHTIHEATAAYAMQLNSFGTYEPGSATQNYHELCNEIYDAAEAVAIAFPYLAEKAEAKAQHYAKKLADYFNAYYKNEASCPSVLISGPANFPTQKKEKQNRRRETLHAQWEQLESYAQSIRTMGTHCISANDPQAVERLREKINQMETVYARWQALERYYKKYHTMIGCPIPLTEVEQQQVDYMRRHDFDRFGIFDLTNLSARIRQTKERLATLEKEKERGTKTTETDFCTIIENTEIMRLQLIFTEKPVENIRHVLKSNGFHWSPKNGAWQRQLTNNARYAAKKVLENLKTL